MICSISDGGYGGYGQGGYGQGGGSWNQAGAPAQGGGWSSDYNAGYANSYGGGPIRNNSYQNHRNNGPYGIRFPIFYDQLTYSYS